MGPTVLVKAPLAPRAYLWVCRAGSAGFRVPAYLVPIDGITCGLDKPWLVQRGCHVYAAPHIPLKYLICATFVHNVIWFPCLPYPRVMSATTLRSGTIVALDCSDS